MSKIQVSQPNQYHVFILRIWQEENAGISPAPRRILLQTPQSDQKKPFNSFNELVAHLEQTTTSSGDL